RRQLVDLNGAAGGAERPAVGDEVAVERKKPGARARRLDEAAHHLAAELGDQLLAFADRIDDCALAESRGEDLALRPQGLQLGIDEARLVAPQIEEAETEQGERQDVDGEDAQGKRREAPPPRLPLLARARRRGALAAGGAALPGRPLSDRGSGIRHHRASRSGRTPYR